MPGARPAAVIASPRRGAMAALLLFAACLALPALPGTGAALAESMTDQGTAQGTTAQGMRITAAYATATPRSAAVYFRIENATGEDDRLTGITSPAASGASLHRSSVDAAGIARMQALPEGIALPAGTTHELAPGGDHVMLTGLAARLAPGARLPLTLTFEHAAPLALEVEVALPGTRPDHSAGHSTP